MAYASGGNVTLGDTKTDISNNKLKIVANKFCINSVIFTPFIN